MRILIFWPLFACLTFLACVSNAASTPPATPAMAQGINLSNWLANAFRQPVFEDDMRQIRAVGFDHVRIPVNPEHVGFSLSNSTPPSAEQFSEVRRAVDMAVAQNLNVVLDMHPSYDFRKQLEDGGTFPQERFILLWQFLAKNLQDIPENKLIFGVLNEPQYYERASQYQEFVHSLVASIRSVDPKRTLIVSAARGASIEGLLELTPLNDPAILYEFHFYEPFIFTHQGIHQGFEGKMVRAMRQLPYPSSFAIGLAQAYAGGRADPVRAAYALDEYRTQSWDAEKITLRLQQASGWAKQHGVRLYCGEFGVRRNDTDIASRMRWIHDTRRALESLGISWALWDYTDLFGITTLEGKVTTDPVDSSVRFVNPAIGKRVFEPEALTALGLIPPTASRETVAEPPH